MNSPPLTTLSIPVRSGRGRRCCRVTRGSMRSGSRRGTSFGCATPRMVGLRPERLVPPYVSAHPTLLTSTQTPDH